VNLKHPAGRWLAAACAVAFLTSAVAAPAAPTARVDAARIQQVGSEPGAWPSHGRGYDEARHSPLTQIRPDNLQRLGLAWSMDLDTPRGQEATPLVVDGVMYTTTAWSKVMAVDAASGRRLWTYDPHVPGQAAVKGCCDVVNRGAALWQGKVFVGTFDGRLIALDARTGKLRWSTLTVDPRKPYTITGAPRVVKGKVLIGNGGAEMGVRGYLSAYDANTGRLAWRFYTTPNPQGRPDGAASDQVMAERAGATWFDGAWRQTGGGGTVWDAMAYDPALDLLYVGVGNGSPWNYQLRSGGRGDNLFLSSILALRPDTGEYVWHYQTTPGEEWDFTATQHMILADLNWQGRVRQVLMQVPKNGFFYVIDRASGELLAADPVATITWAKGVDLKTGRPDVVPEARYSATGRPFLAQPSFYGAHNWHPMSYDAGSGLVFFPLQEIAFPLLADSGYEQRELAANLGVDLSIAALPRDRAARDAVRKSLKGFLVAWDPVARKEVWRVPLKGPWNGGVLSTAGGVVFQGTSAGELVAYRATTGERLWAFETQTGVVAPPMSYAVNGRQFIGLMVGWGGTFALLGNATSHIDGRAGINRSRLLAFALDGQASLPAALAATPRVVSPLPPALEPQRLARVMSVGAARYGTYCAACHGGEAVSGGVLPDLRHSEVARHKRSFDAVVRHGVFTPRGMVSFAPVMTEAETDLIRDYVIERARDTQQ